MPTKRPSHDNSSPFHDGETAVHERYGIRERIDQVGRAVIRSAMPLQHREFFATLPMLLVGSLDGEGRPWASLLTGAPGFVDAGDEQTLRVRALPMPGDPLAANLQPGAPLGLLGIVLATRRRNRLNGTLVSRDDAGFTLRVDQSFGNCPQYIQARGAEWPAGTGRSDILPRVDAFAKRLTDAAARIVNRADTMFLASASAHADDPSGTEGVDVSHRGGNPGFVRVQTAPDGVSSVLTIPDFRGNFLFNTIGNLSIRPRAGLLFLDFDSGDLLQLTGVTEIVWDGPEVESFAGAQRLVKLTLDSGLLHHGAVAARWSPPEMASQLEDTGAWPRAAG